MANHQDAFQAALAQARAAAQKFRDEGKLPPEDTTTAGNDLLRILNFFRVRKV